MLKSFNFLCEVFLRHKTERLFESMAIFYHFLVDCRDSEVNSLGCSDVACVFLSRELTGTTCSTSLPDLRLLSQEALEDPRRQKKMRQVRQRQRDCNRKEAHGLQNKSATFVTIEIIF